MKKMLSITLASVLLFCLAACDSGSEELTPYAAYVQASQKLAEADSYEAEMLMDLTMGAQGVSIDMGVESTVKQVKKGNSADLEMQMAISMMGMSIDMTMYYTDGTAYMEVMGMKAKQPMSYDEALSQANYNVQFSEEAVKDAKIEQTSEGSVITFVLDKDAMNGALDGQLDGVLSGMMEGTEAGAMISDVAMIVTLDKSSALKSMDMTFEMAMEMSGQQVDCTAHVVMNIMQQGGVSITFPDDLDSYEEADTPM